MDSGPTFAVSSNAVIQVLPEWSSACGRRTHGKRLAQGKRLGRRALRAAVQSRAGLSSSEDWEWHCSDGVSSSSSSVLGWHKRCGVRSALPREDAAARHRGSGSLRLPYTPPRPILPYPTDAGCPAAARFCRPVRVWGGEVGP